MKSIFCLVMAIFTANTIGQGKAWSIKPAETPVVRKVKDVVIYKDARFHSAFPSVVKAKNGVLLVGFRLLTGQFLGSLAPIMLTRIAIWSRYVRKTANTGQKSRN